MPHTQYVSKEKYDALEAELKELKEQKVPDIAKRIDEAKQLGDLSENAEYHDARDQMSWAQSRLKEIGAILQEAEIISSPSRPSGIIVLGSIVILDVNGKQKEYAIVGAQEADPLAGKISNESPLGEALIGKIKGDVAEVQVPSGTQLYRVIDVK